LVLMEGKLRGRSDASQDEGRMQMTGNVGMPYSRARPLPSI